VPDFILEITQRRRLGDDGLSKVNLKSIFNVLFSAKSDEDPEKLGYYLLLEKWTATEFEYKIVFDDPLSVSQGD
jgi:hypothetical protein